MISLTRLERQIQIGLAMNRPPTETMQVLAGLQHIRYVFVYPESGDLVIAGPAGDWTLGPERASWRSNRDCRSSGSTTWWSFSGI